MNISKKAAQELLSQNFYNQDLRLSILDTNGVVLATNTDQSAIADAEQRLVHLRHQLESNPAHSIEITDDQGDIFHFSKLYQETSVIGYFLIHGPKPLVRSQSKLILTIVTMFLNSNFKFHSSVPLTDRERLDTFLRELISADGKINPYLTSEAKYFKLNINHPLYMAAIYSDTPFTDDDPLYNLRNRINGRNTLLTPKILLIIFESKTAIEYIKQWCQPTTRVGISTKTKNLNTAYHEAIKTALLTEWLKPEKAPCQNIAQFDELKSFMPIVDAKINVQNIIDTIAHFDTTVENHELLETFWTFFQNNGRIKATADELHIHRNTLSFRLDTLSEICDLDLHSYEQRTLMYIAMVKYKTYALQSSIDIADDLLTHTLK
ncbi:helix-turn-helix domain-containing protein [Weissella diestrammenae]|uniref:Helix-turn-helix domain-containing protein n=1 Tax=Weissella diestrammenae TaxID=1162633 RepID=A0A7G9T7B0_9LACO|nr:helix-turn-helix domain-containing protein [Weissella diestrammenae]MCM0581995.1 helix-turn-helix domain-containing protein [Weissella diestrammenae]QNN75985.1 helix-turn-helix domain-containing protein [Weissella diestrammenae]